MKSTLSLLARIKSVVSEAGLSPLHYCVGGSSRGEVVSWVKRWLSEAMELFFSEYVWFSSPHIAPSFGFQDRFPKLVSRSKFKAARTSHPLPFLVVAFVS